MAQSANIPNYYFCFPENDQLPTNYDLVDTRLYDIRHCLNIKGQEQALALFQPPIDPMALVAAGAEGLSLSDVPINTGVEIPYYRFDKMIEYSKSVTQRVIDFGRQILSVLQMNDSEALELLRASQEQTILDMTTSMKELNIQELINQAGVLGKSLDSANARVNYYTEMLSMPVSALEIAALAYNADAILVEAPAAALHVAAAIGHLVPTVFGFADGDLKPGDSIEAGATELSLVSSILNNTANMTATSASYIRRKEDWDLQLKLAQEEVASIGIQQAINTIRQQNAQKELELHNQSINNNMNLQSFYNDKFTNQELYQWMISQISAVYYQAYNTAYTLATQAQTAYHFELNTSDLIVSYGYWDSSKKGLLAGEKLATDLDLLEKAYIDKHERYLEIQKVVSLKDIDPIEYNKLITTGKCYVNLTEKLFDYDFPGHYNRKIKSVSVTVPAVVGPYQTIKASLVQQTNYVVLEPNLDTVSFLMAPSEGSQPPEYSLRQNWRPNQQIAISKAANDSGMFELNFNDSRYLPFEGTGAVSAWELSIPQGTNQFDTKTISDVIFYIDYTAQDGGERVCSKSYELTSIEGISWKYNCEPKTAV